MTTESEQVRILRENELLKAELAEAHRVLEVAHATSTDALRLQGQAQARAQKLEALGKKTVRHLYRNDSMEGSRDSFLIEEWEAALAEGDEDADANPRR